MITIVADFITALSYISVLFYKRAIASSIRATSLSDIDNITRVLLPSIVSEQSNKIIISTANSNSRVAKLRECAKVLLYKHTTISDKSKVFEKLY